MAGERTLKVVTTVRELDEQCAEWRRAGRSIASVPTMGALHDGHLSLVDLAAQQCDIVVGSIFVNPLQFGLDEDFDSYPKPLEQDLALLEKHGTTLAFIPEWTEIFARRERTIGEFG